MDRKAVVNKIPKPTKSKQLISLDEFLVRSTMRHEQKAGFEAYVNLTGNKKYNSEESWRQLLLEYNTRTL